MSTTKEFQERVGRVEGLVQKLESAADPILRRTARELVESLMAIHGAGLERILEIVSNPEEAGAGLVQRLANDPLVSSLLVLYGLHPEGFEARVRRALDHVRPALRSDGVRIEALAVDETVVRLKLAGPASNRHETAVREALFETAPDAVNVMFEGVKQAPAGQSPGFVPLASLRTLDGSPAIAVADPT